jgi:hypothetical protein
MVMARSGVVFYDKSKLSIFPYATMCSNHTKACAVAIDRHTTRKALHNIHCERALRHCVYDERARL